MKNLIPFGQKIQNDNYPYGSLRATAFFSLEFQPKKGFRSVFQTINPKTNRVNNPKKSTYSDLMYMYTDTESGHTKTLGLSVNGSKEIVKTATFLAENAEAIALTEDQIKWLCANIAQSLIISAAYMRVNIEEGKAFLIPYVKMAKEALKTGSIDWNELAKIDLVKYETYFAR